MIDAEASRSAGDQRAPDESEDRLLPTPPERVPLFPDHADERDARRHILTVSGDEWAEEIEQFQLTSNRIAWTSTPSGEAAGQLERDELRTVGDRVYDATRPARNASAVCITPRNSARPLSRPMKE